MSRISPAAGVLWAAVVLMAATSVKTTNQSTPAAQHQETAGWRSNWPPLPKTGWQAAPPNDVRNAYEFAALHPEVMRYIPCFCGCARLSHHGSSEDCFVSARPKGSVSWNAHGQVCPMCVAIGLQVRQMYLDGKSTREIRTAIEKKYGAEFGAARTETPIPPSEAERR